MEWDCKQNGNTVSFRKYDLQNLIAEADNSNKQFYSSLGILKFFLRLFDILHRIYSNRGQPQIEASSNTSRIFMAWVIYTNIDWVPKKFLL